MTATYCRPSPIVTSLQFTAYTSTQSLLKKKAPSNNFWNMFISANEAVAASQTELMENSLSFGRQICPVGTTTQEHFCTRTQTEWRTLRLQASSRYLATSMNTSNSLDILSSLKTILKYTVVVPQWVTFIPKPSQHEDCTNGDIMS